MTANKCWCGGDIAGSCICDGAAYEQKAHPFIVATNCPIHGSGKLTCKESAFHDPTATGRPGVVRKLYVAGPMTGYPECNYPAFNQAAEALRAAGYEVVNPADSSVQAGHYVDFLKADLREMLGCDGVAFLDRWWESTGARNEIQVAGVCMMPVRSVEDWLLIGAATTGLDTYLSNVMRMLGFSPVE